nr:hypothetical protein [Streptococcus suis]
MYLWKAPNRLIERFIPFFLNHAFIKALRHTQRPSVKGFVPYLVKLPVPLVPLEKIPVPALHLPKLHKELFRHFQLVGFALPVLKADKIPCAAFRCRSPRKGFLPHSCGVFRRWHAPRNFGTFCPEVRLLAVLPQPGYSFSDGHSVFKVPSIDELP